MHGALPSARDRPESKSGTAPGIRLPGRPSGLIFYILTLFVLFATWARHSSTGISTILLKFDMNSNPCSNR